MAGLVAQNTRTGGRLAHVAGETHGTVLIPSGAGVDRILADPAATAFALMPTTPLAQHLLPARNEWVCTFYSPARQFPNSVGSRIPFSAILNISDHCDFDSPVLLSDNVVFCAIGLNIIRGLFVSSDKSLECIDGRQADLLRDWAKDGHELCYHSLSQSTVQVIGGRMILIAL